MAIFTPDQEDLRKLVAQFAKKEIAPRAAHYDHTEEFPTDNLVKMAELGLLGLPISEQYGGAAVDTVSYAAAIEEISKACASTGAIMAVHTSAGIMPIYLFGTEAQKQKYVPAMWTSNHGTKFRRLLAGDLGRISIGAGAILEIRAAILSAMSS